MRRAIVSIGCVLLVALLPIGPAFASHEDGLYSISAWDMWDRGDLNVLVVPPTHGPIFGPGGWNESHDTSELTPFNTYLRAVEDSIGAWSAAAQTFGSVELKKAFNPNVYVLGRDTPPPEALASPDIVITTTDFTPIGLGVAFRPYPCFVNNSNLTGITSYADIFNINGQEYGHCLGVNHVGSQGGVDPTSPLQHPEHDIMNGFYTHDVGEEGTHLHCISNLDVLALNFVLTHKNAGSIPVFHRETDDLVMTVDHYRTTCGADGLEPDLEKPYPPVETSSSRITTPRDRDIIKSDQFDAINGIVEGRGAAGAEIALSRTRDGHCYWWRPKKMSLRPGNCDAPFWIEASGGSQWDYVLRSTLSRGRYQVFARAIDPEMGVVEENIERGRNLISFRLK